MVNMFIAFFCMHDLMNVVSSPLCTMVEPSSSWQPSYLAFMLHFYHLTCFTSLRLEDVVHHLLFAGALGAFNFLLVWGRMTNLLIFFMTGLPGGIDYAMLVVVKKGYMDRLKQKAICSSINTWMRTPGHVATAGLMLFCTRHGATFLPFPAFTVTTVAALCLLNGIYYGEQAVGTFHRMAEKRMKGSFTNLAALSPTFADKQVGMLDTNDTSHLKRP
jgi:hypothetical protein